MTDKCDDLADLANEIEQYIYERGEYEPKLNYPIEWVDYCIDACAEDGQVLRDDVANHIAQSMQIDSAAKRLYRYFERDYPTLSESDPLRIKNTELQLRISEYFKDKDFDIQDDVLEAYIGHKTRAVIPDGVRKIAAFAFLYEENIKNITLPDTVRSIGEHAFLGCTNLKSVTLPDGLQSIGRAAFKCCHNLESIIIPESVERIGDFAFSDCENLKSASIPADCDCGINVFDRSCNVTRRNSEPQTRKQKV